MMDGNETAKAGKLDTVLRGTTRLFTLDPAVQIPSRVVRTAGDSWMSSEECDPDGERGVYGGGVWWSES